MTPEREDWLTTQYVWVIEALEQMDIIAPEEFL